MARKLLWVLFAGFAVLIGLYPGVYFIFGRDFGFLTQKPAELLANLLWNIGFYVHIVPGGLALMIGWTQFSTKLRKTNLKLHRQLGKIYVISVLLSALAAIGIGFFATGGIWSAAGFVSLGVIWFYTTLMAYLHIKNGQLLAHQKMMIYSYAACFAAVTLRVWLPLLVAGLGDFIRAYTIVAWLCWVPNLMVAHLIVRKIKFATV